MGVMLTPKAHETNATFSQQRHRVVGQFSHGAAKQKLGCEYSKGKTEIPSFAFRIAKRHRLRQCKYMGHTNFQLCKPSRHNHGGTI